MALVCDAGRGPFGAIPALVRTDRRLEFAASVTGALAALRVEVLRHLLLAGIEPTIGKDGVRLIEVYLDGR